MQIIIRVDDVGWGLKKRIDSLMADYSQFHSLFAERNIPYCPCIIPAICDESMVKWMVDNFYSEVAPCLHGWNHERSTTPDDEFGGLEYYLIEDKLRKGIKQLDPLKVWGMSSPWNRYDNKVIDACKNVGLNFFFMGYGREKEEKFYANDDFVVLPVTPSLYVRSGEALKSIKRLDKLSEQDYPHVLTLHCTWEYPNLKGNDLAKLLDNLKEKHEIVDIKKWLIEFLQ